MTMEISAASPGRRKASRNIRSASSSRTPSKLKERTKAERMAECFRLQMYSAIFFCKARFVE